MKIFNTLNCYLLKFLVMGTLFSSSALAQVSMNDVTFLLPIPKNLADLKANYLNSSTVLSTGSLVSSSNLKLFDWTGIQADLDMTQRDNIDRLVVLGIRLDPCFKDHFTDNCRAQIRLVLQPAVFTTGTLDTADVGIHVFFDTTPDQILSLIRFASNYRNQFLGSGSAKAPLQIQPVIQQEGITGKFWQAMKPMIQNVLNQSNRTRVAFFVVQPSGRAWTFKSFDLIGNTAAPISIAGINSTVERIDNQIQNSTIEFQATSGVLPRSSFGSDQTFDFMNDSINFRNGGLSRLNPLMLSLERVENPGMHLPGTIDCLTCHSTPSIKTDLRKNNIHINTQTIASFIGQTLPASSMINLFEDNYQSRDFRLLGYRNGNPIVGQRVINESASIVDGVTASIRANLNSKLALKQAR